MRYLIILIFAFLISAVQQGLAQITMSISDSLSDGVKDGRLVLLFHHNDQVEPRFAVSDEVNSAQVFGMDFTDFDSQKPFIFDSGAFGYPVKNLKGLPDGNFFVQAFIIKHETFARSDGYTVLMPMDQGEGRQWNRPPGNVYSLPENTNWRREETISYLTEAFLEKTTTPYYAGEVMYGDRAEHCWNGAPDLPNYICHLRYNTLHLDKIAKRLLETAPKKF